MGVVGAIWGTSARRKAAKRPVGLNTVQMLKACSSRLGMSPAETMRLSAAFGVGWWWKIYLENKLLLISINLTRQNQPQLHVFQVASSAWDIENVKFWIFIRQNAWLTCIPPKVERSGKIYTPLDLFHGSRRSIDDPIPSATGSFARPHRKGSQKCGKSPA